MIHPPVESELHKYIGGLCNKLECIPIKIGGYTDHLHILCKMSSKITLAKLVGDIKANSSKWIKTKGAEYENFYWQRGYGAFSVNPADVDKVINYIANQHRHHSKISFQDEYREYLMDNDIEFDERFIWD